MNDTNVCPRDCRVRLEHLEERQRKDTDTHRDIWEELKMKVTQKLFFWMMGVAVFVLLSLFGAIYHQGSMTLEKVQAAQLNIAKTQEQLKSLTRPHANPSGDSARSPSTQ